MLSLLKFDVDQTIDIPNVTDQTGLNPFTLGTPGDLTLKISKDGTDRGALTLVAGTPAAADERQITQPHPGTLRVGIRQSDVDAAGSSVDVLGKILTLNLSDPDAMVPVGISFLVVPVWVYAFFNGVSDAWFQRAFDFNCAESVAAAKTRAAFTFNSDSYYTFYQLMFNSKNVGTTKTIYNADGTVWKTLTMAQSQASNPVTGWQLTGQTQS